MSCLELVTIPWKLRAAKGFFFFHPTKVFSSFLASLTGSRLLSFKNHIDRLASTVSLLSARSLAMMRRIMCLRKFFGAKPSKKSVQCAQSTRILVHRNLAWYQATIIRGGDARSSYYPHPHGRNCALKFATKRKNTSTP